MKPITRANNNNVSRSASVLVVFRAQWVEFYPSYFDAADVQIESRGWMVIILVLLLILVMVIFAVVVFFSLRPQLYLEVVEGDFAETA